MSDIPDPRYEGGLWCGDVLRLLDAYVAELLAAGDRSAVDTHLRACDQCARFGGAYADLVTALRGSSGDAPTLDQERASRLDAALRELLGDV